MPRIGDRVRVRANGRTAVIRGVDSDPRLDRYAIVYEDPAAARQRPDDPAPDQVGDEWHTADELEVIT